MCRVLAYMGPRILLDDILYKPSNSLINQTFDPKLTQLLNLAGFGMTVWDKGSNKPQVPHTYHSLELPFFDRNLKNLSEKISTNVCIAHIRGVMLNERSTVIKTNLHPFFYPGFSLAFAHNGDLKNFGKMRFDLSKYLHPEVSKCIQGNTDTEWIYAVLLSQLENPKGHHTLEEVHEALEKTLKIIRQVREKNDIFLSSPVNLFLSNGDFILIIRFVFDFGWYDTNSAMMHQFHSVYKSLWFTTGSSYEKRNGKWLMVGDKDATDAILVSSEPITEDDSTWLPMPEYHAMAVFKKNGKQQIRLTELNV